MVDSINKRLNAIMITVKPVLPTVEQRMSSSNSVVVLAILNYVHSVCFC
jgi:hypothetical protein